MVTKQAVAEHMHIELWRISRVHSKLQAHSKTMWAAWPRHAAPTLMRAATACWFHVVAAKHAVFVLAH